MALFARFHTWLAERKRRKHAKYAEQIQHMDRETL